MSEQNKKAFKQKFINQILRVTTKNKRVFQGTLKVVDFRSNLILHNTVAQIPQDQNCPLNSQLDTFYDQKLSYTPDPNLSEQEQKKAKDEYMRSHYYIGAVMISGEDVVKAELRSPPVSNKDPNQQKQAANDLGNKPEIKQEANNKQEQKSAN